MKMKRVNFFLHEETIEELKKLSKNKKYNGKYQQLLRDAVNNFVEKEIKKSLKTVP